jgi:nucleoside-diphosphate-sugar epimerase
MTTAPEQRSALVFGSSGFLGRWLVRELLDQDVRTTAAVRSDTSARGLLSWLGDHGVATEGLDFLHVDLTVDGLSIEAGTTLYQSCEVYNLAGAYAFGMTRDEARRANVDTAARVVELSSTLGASRLVHVSGYRVGGQDPASVPWSPQHIRVEYDRMGAYEASKAESDAVVQAAARTLGVALTIINPATVIGHSATGESNQILGLGTTVLDLIAGRLRAIPGGPSVFVPVVTVDYLTRFMALVPTLDETADASYWVLDPDTPTLPDLLRLIGTHRSVWVPRLRLPVRLVRLLPKSLTNADPEVLGFLSTDRYPTGPAEDLARAHGLHHPDVTVSLRRWSDYLVSRVPGAHASRPSAPDGSPVPALEAVSS